MSPHIESALISPYIDGEMQDSERTAFEAHLASCSECTTLVTAIRSTMAELRALGEAEIPVQASWAVRSAVSRARTRGMRAGRFAIATASVAALLAGIGVAVLHGPTASHREAVSGAAGTKAAPAISYSDTNYDAATARAVFSLVGTSAELGSETTSGPAGVAPNAALPQPAVSAAAPMPTPAADFQTCAGRIASGAHEPSTAVLYLIARYAGARAYFMVFDVPSGSPTRRELWIVKPGTCAVLRFEQTRLK